MIIESLKNASPADIATLLTTIKLISQEKNWIPKTQLAQIDTMLSQLYRAQGKYIRQTTARPAKKKENADVIQ